MVPRQRVPQAVRQAQDPLANGDDGEHVIDQVRRALGHPAAAAARTHRPALAGKRYQPVQPAAGTPKSGEAPGKEPAAQEAAKLFLDEPRQPVPVGDPRRLGPKRLEVIAHHPVQHALGGPFGRVGGGRTTHAPAVAKRTPPGSDRDLRGIERVDPSTTRHGCDFCVPGRGRRSQNLPCPARDLQHSHSPARVRRT